MLLGYGSEAPEGQVSAEVSAAVDEDLKKYRELLASQGQLETAKDESVFQWSSLTPEELNEIF